MSESLCPLLDAYLELVDNTESPILYHRWSILAAVAAMLERRVKIELPLVGSIYPNLYVILLGPPASRKNGAIDLAIRMVQEAGYNKIASGKTSSQKFLSDLYDGFDSLAAQVNELDLGSDGIITTPTTESISSVLIGEGELQAFLGNSNIDFISMLTNLFDNKPYYDDRTKNGVSRRIIKPTISLLGGATSVSFRRMFPVDILGQGLLSRFLLIHGSGPRCKLFIPNEPDMVLHKEIIQHLKQVYAATNTPTSYTFTTAAYDYSKLLYETATEELTDPRFEYYNGRRNTQYMKLITIIAACNFHKQIEESDCILANTILSYTEKFMPKALGEFGLDKNADHTEHIHKMIKSHPGGCSLAQLLNQGLSLVHNPAELVGHLHRLISSGRVDKITVKDEATVHYINVDRTVVTKSKMVNYELLKEFRENQTFDTAFKPDRASELEYELKAEYQKLQGTGLDDEFSIMEDAG